MEWALDLIQDEMGGANGLGQWGSPLYFLRTSLMYAWHRGGVETPASGMMPGEPQRWLRLVWGSRNKAWTQGVLWVHPR